MLQRSSSLPSLQIPKPHKIQELQTCAKPPATYAHTHMPAIIELAHTHTDTHTLSHTTTLLKYVPIQYLWNLSLNLICKNNENDRANENINDTTLEMYLKSFWKTKWLLDG